MYIYIFLFIIYLYFYIFIYVFLIYFMTCVYKSCIIMIYIYIYIVISVLIWMHRKKMLVLKKDKTVHNYLFYIMFYCIYVICMTIPVLSGLVFSWMVMALCGKIRPLTVRHFIPLPKIKLSHDFIKLLKAQMWGPTTIHCGNSYVPCLPFWHWQPRWKMVLCKSIIVKHCWEVSQYNVTIKYIITGWWLFSNP